MMESMNSWNTWDIFAIIGTFSFALQGGLIAMEKRYDLFAVYLFGLLTAFGGGALQNIIIGGSDYQLWNQEPLFWIALVAITLGLAFPVRVTKNKLLLTKVLDAFGVVSFAIQGSITAIYLGLPMSAVVVSALVTATGGGLIRDVLSQRKPVLLGEDIYGLWIFLIGLIMGIGGKGAIPYQYLLFVAFSTLRIFSIIYDWIIPYRHY